jgi:hypothetical protein
MPASLVRKREAFDHPDFLFEVKFDGWRALAYLEDGRSELVSRKGNALKSFESLRAALARLPRRAVLDGARSSAWMRPASRSFTTYSGADVSLCSTLSIAFGWTGKICVVGQPSNVSGF